MNARSRLMPPPPPRLYGCRAERATRTSLPPREGAPMVLAIDWSTGVENAWSDIAEFVPKFLAFLVILIIGYVVARVLSRIADAALERLHFDEAVERGGIAKAM